MSNPTKGAFVTNPNTKRAIKVGGRVYMKLVAQGILEGNYQDDNEVYQLQEDEYDDDSKIEQYKEEYTKKLPKNQHVVKGRGRYKNKLVTRYKPKSRTQQACANIIDGLDEYDEPTQKMIKQSMQDGSLDAYVESVLNESNQEEYESEYESEEDEPQEAELFEEDVYEDEYDF